MNRRNLAGLLDEILQSRFFVVSCSFTREQIKAGDDRICLLQGMMLLDAKYVAGFGPRDFSEGSALEYSESIKDNYSDKQRNVLKSAIQYLTDAFPEKDQNLKKANIPIVVYISDAAMDAGIRPMSFRRWWEVFTKEDILFGDDRLPGGKDTAKLEKAGGRLAVMAKSFSAYYGVGIPAELKGWG